MNLFYSFKTFFNNSSKTSVCRHEGMIRETLAAYFLSAPPFEQQTAVERKQYQRALRYLAEIEIQALLQSANSNRPLRYGDLTGLLSSTLHAAKRLLQNNEVCLQCRYPDTSVCTAAEPRLIQMSMIRLIRAFITANPQFTVKISITVRRQSIIVSVSSRKLPHDENLVKLLHETARLHKGCVIISGSTIAFSLHRELPNPIGLFAVPTTDELLNNPISTVNVGLA